MCRNDLLKLAVLLLFVTTTSVAQEQPSLIRLPKQATSPSIGIKKGGVIGPMGKEMHLGGWLVLNGARFRNSEYPELAKTLAENYAQQGYTSKDPDFTQLPAEQSEADPHGQIVRGFAICPSPALCGDLTGSIMPFDLNSSL
jgi:hypothetical protein